MRKIEPPANTLYIDHVAYQSTISYNAVYKHYKSVFRLV